MPHTKTNPFLGQGFLPPRLSLKLVYKHNKTKEQTHHPINNYVVMVTCTAQALDQWPQTCTPTVTTHK